MSFALHCSLTVKFEFGELKNLNSNYLNPNFVMTSSFFGNMLERNGLVHQDKHNELCPALQFRDQRTNIHYMKIAQPKPCTPFAIKI